MNAVENLVLNFEEIRRRSTKLWEAMPASCYDWKPDAGAMTCLEMVRHVLEGEHLFHRIVQNRGNLVDYVSPWKDVTYRDVAFELEFAQPYREQFISTVRRYTGEELQEVEIIRSEVGQRRKLGDYLLRIAYHEAVHTGQLLTYLRAFQVPRPLVWD
ncbi:DinB family protein [Pontibacter sp. MBLB2868]|uniref:DinB family protein n=1 Tax=Pontibacter sp. MBLB2868 TaxID=3451555 RepID=UPI003F7521C1